MLFHVQVHVLVVKIHCGIVQVVKVVIIYLIINV